MAIDINIGSKLDAKGFKQAETALDKLNKSGKSLARTLGYSFGTAAILRYGKNAVKAFAADEKAARSLTLTLNNLGLAFADPEVKNFISSLESQYGVLDDQLRPAYQKLLTTTGDYKKAQDLLKTSLDLAAMSGSDVVSVAGDLSKAYAGNTRGLQKYGIGLSKTEIAAMSFEDILKQIAIVSAGQAQSAADSYAGSLDRLTVAAANASESIGKDLLTALDTVAGGNGLPKTIQLIESLSSGIGDAVIGLSRLIRNIGILSSGNPLESIRDLQKATQQDRLADAKERATYGGIYADIYKAQAASLATSKKSVVVAKALTKETAAQLKAKQLQNAIDKANLALAKGTDLFDMDKIQIAAALTSQAEQLGKATTGAQILQIANDTARLKVKQDILALEDAIASGDQKAIEAATAKLNADMKILGSLQSQNLKLIDIKSLLDTLKPKDLINTANLEEALRLLGLINLASTGSKSTPAGGYGSGGGGNVANNQYSNQVGNGLYGMQTQAASIADINSAVAAGGLTSIIGSNLQEYLSPTGGLLSGRSANGAEYNFSIAVNTGIGDPNAIAEAVNQVIQDAVDRGTLRGGAY